MQKIAAFLGIDGKAEEAAEFYVSIFKNSKIVGISRYGEQGPGPKGSVMVITFQLDGQDFCAVNCETQKEIDELWEKLSDGGEKQRCGWVTDKYGVSWQIVPSNLGEMLHGAEAEKTDRVMKVVLQMSKLDMESMRQAYEQA